MKAIGYTDRGPISAETAVVEFETDKPRPGPNDLLVEVRGISVNPVDVKVRANRQQPDGEPHILGFDAAGIVKEAGATTTRFKPGDEVFYAGDVTRPGTNAQFHAVDERIVGRKPSSLGFAEAAAMPLTSVTAWEILFDSFGLNDGEGAGDSLLVIGGAGGVGSILIQLAKKVAGLTVIATASRPDTRAWGREDGCGSRRQSSQSSRRRDAGSGHCATVCRCTHANRQALCGDRRIDQAARPHRDDR